MKNIEIETDEWREKIERAFERIKKLAPNHVIVALVVAEKLEDPNQPLDLAVHSNTCEHVCADLCKIVHVSLAAAIEAQECKDPAKN